ncbi:hypothetical protein DYB30_012409 [Aphanomyces astaci]|uniref:Prolyl 4-hydroxylase alpha subunit domain-containing protein n=1 Tax=Aphanomyces astaci TaxID=112090 RepID=A0A397D604_APHAT|nr:hypothetical protein DYB30_012409 [Aphanomyces astaci]
MQKHANKQAVKARGVLAGSSLAQHAASVASAYCLYRVYAWSVVEYYPFGEAYLDTPPLPVTPNSCPLKFTASGAANGGFIPVQDADQVETNSAFVMLNGENQGLWVSWHEDDLNKKKDVDLSMCAQALASFGAKAFGKRGVDVDQATLYDQMDQEVWVWPGIEVGHEWMVDGVRLKTLSLSPKVRPIYLFIQCRPIPTKLDNTQAIFVSKFLSPEECQHVIDLGKDMLQPSPSVSQFNLKGLDRYRTSSTAFMGQEVKTRGASLARLPSREFIEDIQLVRYEDGQMYKVHTDYFTHLDVGAEVNPPALKSFSHWITWVQRLNVISPHPPLSPRHSAAFELQLATLLLQPHSIVNDAMWKYLGPAWKVWMQEHVALKSDYIVSSMISAFRPVNPVVPLCYIRQRWEEIVGVPDATFRLPLLAKYIEPNRHATLFLYLNNVDEGGETVFPLHPTPPGNVTTRAGMPECSRGLAVRPQEGGGVLFYSKHPSGENDYRSLHGGCPPANGTHALFVCYCLLTMFNVELHICIGSIKWGSNVFMWNVPAERGQRLWKFW